MEQVQQFAISAFLLSMVVATPWHIWRSTRDGRAFTAEMRRGNDLKERELEIAEEANRLRERELVEDEGDDFYDWR